MKIYDIICEKYLSSGRAPLYHSMTYSKAEIVFSSDVLNSRIHHALSGEEIPGVSLTRNPRLGANTDAHFGPVWLKFDTDLLLRHGYKILPLDSEWALQQSVEYDQKKQGLSPLHRKMIPDRILRNTGKTTFAEEYLVGEIYPLHKYLKHIVLTSFIPEYARRIIRNYAKTYNIQFVSISDRRNTTWHTKNTGEIYKKDW